MRKFMASLFIISSIFTLSVCSAFAFNPQPEPPASVKTIVNPLVYVGINPQPEPPGIFVIR